MRCGKGSSGAGKVKRAGLYDMGVCIACEAGYGGGPVSVRVACERVLHVSYCVLMKSFDRG